jgi:hypothetical protein
MTKRTKPMSAIDDIGDQIPNVEIDSVILEPNRVVIYLHIDEYIYRNGIGTWITREDYTNLLKIKLNQTSTRNGNASTELVGTKPADQQRLSLEYITSKDRREQIQEIPYRLVLDNFNYEGLTNLSFSATTEISKQDLSDRINFSAVGFTSISSAPSLVQVMNAGQVLTRDVGYFLGDAFYTGPKVQLENGRWITGTTQNEDSEFLTVRNIPNIKVSDFRDIDENIGAQLNLRPSLQEGEIKNGPPTYFSDIKGTRDKEGNLRFMFTFDYKNSYSDSSLYGRLFDDMSDKLQDRVLINSRINSLIVSRERVDRDMKNEGAEAIVISGEPSGDRFRDTIAAYGAIREEELSFQKGTLFLRSFSGADREFKNINTGEYQYSVEAKVEDGIYNFLTFQEKDIESSQAMLSDYRSELDIQGNYDDQTDTYSEEFILKLNERYEFQNLPYIRALVSLSENISFLTGPLTRPKVKKIINTLRFLLSPRTGNKAGVDKALDMLDQLLAKISEIKGLVSRDISSSLKDDPRGNLKYSVQQNFPTTFSASNSFKTGVSFLSPTEIVDSDGAEGLKTIEGLDFEARVEDESVKFFGSKDASFQINVGRRGVTTSAKASSFTYLTPTSVRIGDKTYMVHGGTNTAFSGDMTVDSLTTGDQEDKIRTVMAGLTRPVLAGVAETVLDIAPVSDPDFTEVSNIDEIQTNDAAKAAVTSFKNSLDARPAGYLNPFTTATVTGVASAQPVQKASSQYEETQRKLDNLSSMSRYTDIDTPNIENTSVSQEQLDRELTGLTSTTLTTNDTLQITALNGTSQNLTVPDFADIPNHFKALFTNSVNLGDVFGKIVTDVDNGYNERYNLMLGSIARVMVLTGYRKTVSGKTLIRSPIFAPLTYEIYRQNAGKSLLCQLVPYQNDKIGYRRSNDAAIYNEFFVLKSPTLSTIYGEDTRNTLQADLAQADNLQDLLDIYQTYGIDPGSVGDDGDDDAGNTDADTCAAISDEKTIQSIYGRTK